MKNNSNTKEINLTYIPQGMKTTVGEILELVKADINITDELEGLDYEILEMRVIGSRTTGKAKWKSDLDILMQYKGDAREDDMFNAFCRMKIEIDGIRVDINPIKEKIDIYLKRI